jgi:DNA adenine methylase
MKTFFKWQGNKSKHFKYILPELPSQYITYIEPFIGSGALFLHLTPEQWIINDLNQDNISIWELTKNDPQYIKTEFLKFKRHFLNKTNKEKLVYCRKKTNELNNMIKSNQRTILYMLMSYCAYLGNIFNEKNKFYFTGLEMRVYIDNRCFFLEPSYFNNVFQVSNFLSSKKGKIYNDDYKKILKKAKEGDFVFLDPPYIENHNYGFKYNKNEKLDSKFMSELKKECNLLDKKKVKWLMTQADTELVRKTFERYTIKEYKVYRRGNNSYKNELLIKNY